MRHESNYLFYYKSLFQLLLNIVNIKYCIGFRCTTEIFNYIANKMIAMTHLVLFVTVQSYHDVIDYIPCALYFFPMSDPFHNWKFAPSTFSPFPHSLPLWQPSIVPIPVSVFLFCVFLFLRFFIFHISLKATISCEMLSLELQCVKTTNIIFCKPSLIIHITLISIKAECSGYTS